jgi:FkbM family methyltransferase
MNEVMAQIFGHIQAAGEKKSFLDLAFRNHKDDALNGAQVVLFGAGELGNELNKTFRREGIVPVCFCDNDPSKCGSRYSDTPVISFDELIQIHRNSLIVIAAAKGQYLDSIEQQLLNSGFSADRILCTKSLLNDDLHFMHMYANNGSMSPYGGQNGSHEIIRALQEKEQHILSAYNLLADRKSQNLLISKLALIASSEHFDLFKNFMLSFSEPIREFGLDRRHKETEEYFYFNNDIIQLSPNEIYVDVGAADGDTVIAFIEACKKNSIDYKRIYAFEPDPNNYRDLMRNTDTYSKISYHESGLWSETKVLRFLSSSNSITKEAAALSDAGDIEINVVSLDDFLNGEEITFLKMDPPGNIIPEVIKGASNTIAKYRPKLALGAYHSIEAIFEIPLLINSICPNYKLYLRHNTSHICDTVLYAIA